MTTLPERSEKSTPTKEPGTAPADPLSAPDGEPDAVGGESAQAWGTGDARQMRRSHVRGSSLLVVGRIVTLLLTTATQVVVVRALTKDDFGAFAYALALAGAGRTVLSLGQGRLLSRFMAKYQEERDYPRMFGALFLAIGTIVVTSVVCATVAAVKKTASIRCPSVANGMASQKNSADSAVPLQMIAVSCRTIRSRSDATARDSRRQSSSPAQIAAKPTVKAAISIAFSAGRRATTRMKKKFTNTNRASATACVDTSLVVAFAFMAGMMRRPHARASD